MLRKLLLSPALRPFLLILLLLVLWDLAIRLFRIPAYLIPPPIAVVKQLNRNAKFKHIRTRVFDFLLQHGRGQKPLVGVCA